MRDLDDFNSLEERAWRLTAELEENAQKSGQTINGIDEQSEKTETDIKKLSMPFMAMPPRCRLCVTGVQKVNCLVCNVMDYEQ
jgi:hypothetical protein